MKKKLLFIMNNLNCGGAEKALISLLEEIDYSKYEVDLFLFKHEGIFLNQIPSKVNILSEPIYYKYFDMPIKNALINLVRCRSFKVFYLRIASIYILKSRKKDVEIEQINWKILKHILPKLDKYYDVSIGYMENNPNYFCIDNVKAKVKIGWIHNDYKKLGMNKDIDLNYFEKFSFIFTVSNECLNILRDIFPQYKEKIKLMHNIISGKTIKKLSLDNIDDEKFEHKNINIISVGRLNYQKGFEFAIEACYLLVKKGYKIKWIVIGEGEERAKLETLINKFKILDNFKLIGLRENPYKYIKKADIYVQPSRFEGKSIAIDEAKMLCKPIVVTNFSTVNDQIINEFNGLICDMNSKDISNKIEILIKNNKLKSSLIRNLSNENIISKNNIKALYECF